MSSLHRTHFKKKYLFQSLNSIYGIGLSSSKDLCRRLGFTSFFLSKNVDDDQFSKISELVTELQLVIAGDLQRQDRQKIESLLSIRCYRGIRHRQGLPVRGQRTHTNAKTAKKSKFSRSH